METHNRYGKRSTNVTTKRRNDDAAHNDCGLPIATHDLDGQDTHTRTHEPPPRLAYYCRQPLHTYTSMRRTQVSNRWKECDAVVVV